MWRLRVRTAGRQGARDVGRTSSLRGPPWRNAPTGSILGQLIPPREARVRLAEFGDQAWGPVQAARIGLAAVRVHRAHIGQCQPVLHQRSSAALGMRGGGRGGEDGAHSGVPDREACWSAWLPNGRGRRRSTVEWLRQAGTPVVDRDLVGGGQPARERVWPLPHWCSSFAASCSGRASRFARVTAMSSTLARRFRASVNGSL